MLAGGRGLQAAAPHRGSPVVGAPVPGSPSSHAYRISKSGSPPARLVRAQAAVVPAGGDGGSASPAPAAAAAAAVAAAPVPLTGGGGGGGDLEPQPRPSTSGRAEEPAAPPARGLTLERQLSTLQGLIQAQAVTVAALQAEVASLKQQLQQQQAGAAAAAQQQAVAAQPALQQQQLQQAPPPPDALVGGQAGSPDLDGCMSGYPQFTLEDFRRLPDRLILVRHAESAGNLDASRYAETPDYEIPLSARGHKQAQACGEAIRALLEGAYGPGTPYRLHFVTSPYTRSRQTFVGIRYAFPESAIAAVHEAVQLREQDFGNFQVPHQMERDIKERNRFGRFYYRFPDGESTADVYNRVSILEDNLLRDIRAGEYGARSTIVVISHGLTLRVFLMRWFNWSVEQFLQVYNPPNASPLLINKVSEEDFLARSKKQAGKRQTLRIKSCYELDRACMIDMLKLSPEATLEACDLIGQVFMG